VKPRPFLPLGEANCDVVAKGLGEDSLKGEVWGEKING